MSNNDIYESNSIVDGVKLEVGEEYYFKYAHCASKWERLRVTHYTVNGHAWAGNGVKTDSYYHVRRVDKKVAVSALMAAQNIVINMNSERYFVNGDLTVQGEDLVKMFILGSEYNINKHG